LGLPRSLWRWDLSQAHLAKLAERVGLDLEGKTVLERREHMVPDGMELRDDAEQPVAVCDIATGSG